MFGVCSSSKPHEIIHTAIDFGSYLLYLKLIYSQEASLSIFRRLQRLGPCVHYSLLISMLSRYQPELHKQLPLNLIIIVVFTVPSVCILMIENDKHNNKKMSTSNLGKSTAQLYFKGGNNSIISTWVSSGDHLDGSSKSTVGVQC
jgi:hypothetical protein